MPSHRVQRVGEAIREVVSQSILFEVADPRVKGVTVLGVEVSPDLRQATVLVSIMGTESQRRLALKGIQHAGGFLQAKVAARLQIRFTPILSFKVDEGVRKSVEMSKLIDEALESDRQAQLNRSKQDADSEDESQTSTDSHESTPESHDEPERE